MIINLSNSSSDLKKFKLLGSSFSVKEKLLDLTGTITEDPLLDLIKLRELDSDFKIKSAAIDEYVNYIGNISRSKIGNKAIRKYQIYQLPIYWLTDVSEKHPYYQPILNVFYLKNLLQSGSVKIDKDEKLKIIIPFSSCHYLRNMEPYFEKLEYKVKIFSFKDSCGTTYTFREYLSFLKQRRKEYLLASEKLGKKESDKKDNKNLIFTTVPATWNSSLKRDYILGGIKDLSEEYSQNSSGYLPFFTSFEDIAGWDADLNYRYKVSFPSKLQFNLLLVKAAIQYWQICKAKCNGTNDLINEAGVKEELQRTCSEKFYLLFNYVWFLQYFKNLQKSSNVFYQDELYHPGRIISQAAKVAANKNVSSYGVQHGIIMPGHTVYKITKEETDDQIEKFDAFPLPMSFLVWGNYFENLVSQNSKELVDRIKVAGNTNYITLLNKQKPNSDIKKRENLNILWCTGLLRDVKTEYSFMKDALSNGKNYNLTIRFHPLHNLRTDLNAMLDSNILSKTNFSEGVDLFDDIKNNDVVITCSASTIYIDGLIFGKPVFSIDTDNYYLDKVNFKNLFSIKDNKEFSDNYNKLVSGKLPESNHRSINEFIYTKEDVWKNILTA